MVPCLSLLAVMATGVVNPPDAWAKRHLISDDYTVQWGKVAKIDPTAELEVADAHDHFPWNLDWYRFRPGKDGVEVLSIRYSGGVGKEKGDKWPKDANAVRVGTARVKTAEYEKLLHGLAVVDSATLKEVEREGVSFTWHHFLWHTRLTANKKTLLDLHWCGAPGSQEQLKYPKPQAAMRLVEEVVWSLDFKEYKLTDDDRAWASAKFFRDWKTLAKNEETWWVQDRAFSVIGEVGDNSVLPIFRDILNEEPVKVDPDDPRTEQGKQMQEYGWYRAINAATRLLKKDVRDKPVENMDVEKTRKKVVELLKDVK
jgi:hypothetical protein